MKGTLGKAWSSRLGGTAEATSEWIDRWTTRGLAGYLGATAGVNAGIGRLIPGRGDLEQGSTTVEYAVGAIATAGFAGLLIAVLKSGGVKSLIMNIIQSALAI